MPIISSVTNAELNTQANGKRDVVHVFTDHVGETHEIASRVPASWTETEYALQRALIEPNIVANAEEIELESILYNLSLGNNPFRDELNNPVNPVHLNRNAAIQKVLQHVGNLSAGDAVQYKNSFTHLSNLNQAQVEGLGFTWAQYQTWLASVDSLRTIANNNIKLGGV